MFVKVCGLSTPESVSQAVDAGADAVGFVLTKSPREVAPEEVRVFLPLIPETVKAVAVFRDESAEQAVAIAKEAGVEWVQLHGHRSAHDVATVHDAGMRLIRAVTMGASQDEFGDLGEDLFLIDAAVPGSGEAWDYASVQALGLDGRQWLLAGGLEPGNVAFAAAAAGAWGVDVSSGVEESRGVKDLAKIQAFVEAAKA